jgi:hypothetical protein
VLPLTHFVPDLRRDLAPLFLFLKRQCGRTLGGRGGPEGGGHRAGLRAGWALIAPAPSGYQPPAPGGDSTVLDVRLLLSKAIIHPINPIIAMAASGVHESTRDFIESHAAHSHPLPPLCAIYKPPTVALAWKLHWLAHLRRQQYPLP